MLQEGLLWYDDDSTRSLRDKIARAVQRYRQKFGRDPNACYVHPSVGGEKVSGVGDVRVFESETVLPFHFWIGVQASRKPKRSAASSDV